jgi:hypothetical protein
MFARLATVVSLVAFGGYALGGYTLTSPLDGIHTALDAHRAQRFTDTVDVAVGSPLLDTKGMTAFVTHLQVHQIADGKETLVQEATNTIAFGDSAGTPVARVSSIGHAQTPAGMASVNSFFTFDRRTLGLLSTRTITPRGDLAARANGLNVEFSLPTPSGPQSANLTLSAPAFYAPWSDYIVEELPRREGTVYRVRLWRPSFVPGSPPKLLEETHLYTVTGRENLEVLGKSVSRAWVVEDRIAGQAELAGKMWIVDAPPKLVRWMISGPNGTQTRIDQELASGGASPQ